MHAATRTCRDERAARGDPVSPWCCGEALSLKVSKGIPLWAQGWRWCQQPFRFAANMLAPCVQDNQPDDISEADLLALVDKYNNMPEIHGILVQLPLPKHINEEKV